MFIIFIIINITFPKNSRILNKIHTSNQSIKSYKTFVIQIGNNKVIILVHDLSMIKINYNNIENVDVKILSAYLQEWLLRL
jgi:hypothetical protein